DLGLALVGTSKLDAESIAGDRFEHVRRPERQVETSGGEDRVWAGRRGNTQVLGPDRNQHVRARTDSVGSPQVERRAAVQLHGAGRARGFRHLAGNQIGVAYEAV